MSQASPKARGRPRKHDTSAARAAASRLKRGTTKLTLEVPEPFVQQVKAYARRLRSLDHEEAQRELGANKMIQWTDDPIRRSHFCTFVVDTDARPNRRFEATVSARSAIDANGREYVEQRWEAREIYADANIVSNIANGSCSMVDAAKGLCEAVIRLYSTRF